MLDPHQPDLWVLISFVLFMALLVYKGVPGMIGKALDARANAIRAELDEARRLREEAQALLADYQRKSREAEEEAKGIVEQAKREAANIAAETKKSLAESLARRTKVAEEKIARAEAQAMGEVRAAAIDLAVKASEEIIKERVSGAAASSFTAKSIAAVKAKLN